jgi:hypothetical protein
MMQTNGLSVLAIAVTLLLTACGGKEKRDLNVDNQEVMGQPADAGAMKKFNLGIEQLDKEDYSSAENSFRSLVIENPTSQFHWVAMYNLGASYEGLQKCHEAGIAYRKVARASANKYPRLEAQSLFRLSFAYSCLGFDEKAVAALLDTRRRSSLLQEDVAVAEIPARLAAAYARLGNKKKADEFYAQAQKGVQLLRERNKNRRAIRDVLAKTLFLMGRMVPIEKRVAADPFEYLVTLQQLQLYLLEAVELNSEQWSPMAAKELNRSYQNIWDLVAQVKPLNTLDEELKKQNATDIRFRAASESLTNLKILRASFRRDIDRNSHVEQLRAELDQKQKMLETYLVENAVQTPLSSQAEKMQGLKRQGRTNEPLPIDQVPVKEKKKP